MQTWGCCFWVWAFKVNFWNTQWALQSTYTPFGQEGHDPIHKICPFITHLNQQLQKVYVPDKNICVDEATCPFKGRSWFRAYMKDKPTKWGFKFYKLCESSTGYVLHFEMFRVNRHLINKPCCCLAADAASAGQRLPLVHGQLLLLPQTVPWSRCHGGTMVCGTVRKNGSACRESCAKGTWTQAVDYRRMGSVVVCRWKDKKDFSCCLQCIIQFFTLLKPGTDWSKNPWQWLTQSAIWLVWITQIN